MAEVEYEFENPVPSLTSFGPLSPCDVCGSMTFARLRSNHRPICATCLATSTAPQVNETALNRSDTSAA